MKRTGLTGSLTVRAPLRQSIDRNGIYTGADSVSDKDVQTGDLLFGATVMDVGFSSFGLNDHGQVAFWARLDDGSYVIARADPMRRGVPDETATLLLCFLGLAGLQLARRLKI